MYPIVRTDFGKSEVVTTHVTLKSLLSINMGIKSLPIVLCFVPFTNSFIVDFSMSKSSSLALNAILKLMTSSKTMNTTMAHADPKLVLLSAVDILKS